MYRRNRLTHSSAAGVMGRSRQGFALLSELALQSRLLLAQHLDLALDQRNGRATARVRQPEPHQQPLVALEEIGVALQIARDGLLFGVCRGRPASLSCSHGVLDLDVTCEGYFCGTGQPDVFPRTRPVYA